MNNEELTKLISDTAKDTFNKNIEYLAESHKKEFIEILDENGKVELSAALNRILSSYLLSAIELSTVNTIKVLKSLGVEIHDL